MKCSQKGGGIMEHQILKDFKRLVDCNNSYEALVDKEGSLTYQRFYELSESLGRLLVSLKEENSMIGVFLPHSVHQVALLYGIFLSGNTYVPLEKGMSPERLEYIINDSNCNLIISNKTLIEQLPNKISKKARVIDIETLLYKNTADYKSLNEIEISNETPAYLIYTSGSTGKPKGVQVSYSNLSNLIVETERYFNHLRNGKSILMNALSFDFSIWETIISICTGSTLYMIDDDTRLDQFKLINFMKEKRLTYLLTTPSHCGSLLNTADLFEIDIKNTLNMIMLGAEKLSPNMVNRVYDHFGKEIAFYNAYGPTECTVCSFIKELSPGEIGLYERLGNVPIGTVFQGLKASIKNIDENSPNRGLMYLSGKGVSELGYLGLPEQTNKVFSYGLEKNEYNTGDIVEKIDGDFYFIEREDTQVKIHGYRVELDEIKNILVNHPAISDSVVIFYNSEKISEQKLLAFVVLKSNKEIESEELRLWCKKSLNDYMIPNLFIQIEEIPRNLNGKFDSKSLINQYKEQYISQRENNKNGDQLYKMFADIFGITELDFSKSFFELGGHSLAAIQLQDQIRKEYAKEIPIRRIFESESLDELVEDFCN
ncbi:hypothetical protein CN281_11250 [Bacillus cereus]|nr:hypothetical protein CN281_11250 [Bacillus cereus]PFH95727.1 hypothetical protein COI78_08570 [Bacillus cereus]